MASCRMCKSERYAEICWKHLLDRLNVSYGELHHFFGPGVEESWVRMPCAPVSGANKMDQQLGRSIVVSKVLGANWHTSPPTSLIGWVPAARSSTRFHRNFTALWYRRLCFDNTSQFPHITESNVAGVWTVVLFVFAQVCEEYTICKCHILSHN